MINKMEKDFLGQGFPRNPFSFRGWGYANKMMHNMDQFPNPNNKNAQANPMLNPQQYGQHNTPQQQMQKQMNGASPQQVQSQPAQPPGQSQHQMMTDQIRMAMQQYMRQRYPQQTVQQMMGAQNYPHRWGY